MNAESIENQETRSHEASRVSDDRSRWRREHSHRMGAKCESGQPVKQSTLDRMAIMTLNFQRL